MSWYPLASPTRDQSLMERIVQLEKRQRVAENAAMWVLVQYYSQPTLKLTNPYRHLIGENARIQDDMFIRFRNNETRVERVEKVGGVLTHLIFTWCWSNTLFQYKHTQHIGIKIVSDLLSGLLANEMNLCAQYSTHTISGRTDRAVKATSWGRPGQDA